MLKRIFKNTSITMFTFMTNSLNQIKEE